MHTKMIDFQSNLYLSEDALLEEWIDEGVIIPHSEFLTRYLILSVGALFFLLLLDIYTNGQEDKEEEEATEQIHSLEDPIVNKNEKKEGLFYQQFKWIYQESFSLKNFGEKERSINHSGSNEDEARHGYEYLFNEEEKEVFEKMKIDEVEEAAYLEQHDDSSRAKTGMNFTDERTFLQEKQKPKDEDFALIYSGGSDSHEHSSSEENYPDRSSNLALVIGSHHHHHHPPRLSDPESFSPESEKQTRPGYPYESS